MKSKNTALIATTVIAAIVVPLINILGIWSLLVAVGSDVTSSEWIVNILGFVYGALTMLSAYAVAACVGYSVAMGRNKVSVLLIAFLALPLSYYAIVAMDAHFYGALSKDIVVYNVVNCLIEAVRIAVITLVVFLFTHKAKYTREMKFLRFHTRLSRTAIIAPAALFLWGMISSVAQTVADFKAYGAPRNFSEVVAIASPYIESIIYFAVGYLMTFFLYILFESKKSK